MKPASFVFAEGLQPIKGTGGKLRGMTDFPSMLAYPMSPQGTKPSLQIRHANLPEIALIHEARLR